MASISCRAGVLASVSASAITLGFVAPAAAQITYFKPGDLVVGTVSGSTLDTASSITLNQYDLGPGGTTATMNGSLTLPQIQNGANAPISGEYGSASEGILQLSANGQYLTMMGYGVNANTFNASPVIGAPVVAMSDHYNQGGSTNGDDAAIAVDCLDHPVSHDPAAYAAMATTLQASAPVFGPLLAWGEAGCSVWPVPPTRAVAPVAAPGSPPILVVGTTNDPATPYAWAVSVAHELSRGVLLTRDGDDHVAYFYSACVRDAAQTYLVSGVTPPTGTVCTS